MSTARIPFILLALSGCHPGSTPDSGDSATPLADWRGVALESDGWLRGDLHMHTTWSDGWDDVATVIALAEGYEDPTFLGFHPEFVDNGLDFIAITDHRTVDALADPDYHSDALVLIGGEEYGGPSHAGRLGIREHVDHDPDGDGSSLADHQAAINAAHQEGGVFSPNHPFLPAIPWPWDTRDHDSMEVWNSGWALMSPENTEERLLTWEQTYGPASPTYWRAIQSQGGGASQQARVWYEAQLALGIHIGLVGGSDRHAVFMMGAPATWVLADSREETAIVDGILARHTFVSRNPVAAQVLMEVHTQDQTGILGDAIPVPAAGAQVQITLRVGRADGGLLRLVHGVAVQSEEALQTAELGQVVYEVAISSDDVSEELTLQVQPGDWLYPVVLEPLLAPDLTDEEAALVEEIAQEAAAMDEEDFVGLGTLATRIVDTDVLFDATLCDPEDWLPHQLQCMPADADGWGTFFVPDLYDRAFNVVTEGDQITDWCMGALGSAVMFVGE